MIVTDYHHMHRVWREAIARADMPQVSAKKHDDVVERMIQAGVDVDDFTVDIDLLKPVQDGINRQKVENIKQAIRDGEEMYPIVVSREGYVIDGHHRMVAMQELGEEKINCSVVKLPKSESLHVVEYFADGIIKESSAKIPMTFWITYHPGDFSKNVKPFVVDVYTDESRARQAAGRDPILGFHRVDISVPHRPKL